VRFFDPDRPKQPSGVPALRLDGAALPTISVLPVAEGQVRLSVWLRELDSGHPNSFSGKHIILPTNQLRDFFDCYTMDPEETLAAYFGWEDRKPWQDRKPTVKPSPRPAPALSAELTAAAQAFADLF
jgi:hypothetical protein